MTRKQRLELTWIGKDERPRLEPRILIEDPEKSYHARERVSENDIFDNRLIFGDNLLALKALEQEFSGQVKCIYIDPPFNTGAAIEHYDDSVEHSTWLSLIQQRIEIIYRILRKDGAFFIHLDDNELDYCKIVLDEIFGRSNFINRITIDARAPSAFSTVNPGVFKASEYLLWYAKDRSLFQENSDRVRREPDYAYNKWLANPNASPAEWRLVPIMEAYNAEQPTRSRHPKSLLEHFNNFMIENASRVCRLASISDSGAGQSVVSVKYQSLQSPGRVFYIKREKQLDDIYILDGQQLIFYVKNISNVDGTPTATRLLTNIWTDIAWEGIANEGGVQFKKGKKPERLLRRCIELTTDPGDIVLDSFAGSGTTGAVAHKMGRRWIMVELGEHCHTHIIPRLKKVIDGADPGGITEAVGWKGGGGFRYYRLAPSLLEKDRWGNWVISREFNAAMLAEAVCKLTGFTYAPSEQHYWLHGRSSERDFIYVTTQSLTHDQLRAIAEDVGPERTLLICCKAFHANVDAFDNLTVKKIPQAVLQKCEWGRDDYSLAIANLPPAAATLAPAEDDHPAEAVASAAPKRRGRPPKAAEHPSLFPSEEGER